MTAASNTYPSFMCVPVFIFGKLGLKPVLVKILGLKFEEAKSTTRPDRAAEKIVTLQAIYYYKRLPTLMCQESLFDIGLWCVGM